MTKFAVNIQHVASHRAASALNAELKRSKIKIALNC